MTPELPVSQDKHHYSLEKFDDPLREKLTIDWSNAVTGKTPLQKQARTQTDSHDFTEYDTELEGAFFH